MKITFDIFDFNHQIFAFTVIILRLLAQLTGLSYEMINIIVWFILIPILICFLIHKYFGYFSILVWVYFLWHYYEHYTQITNKLFKWSVDFLLKIGKLMNMDYLTISSIICLYVPYLVVIVLIILKNKGKTKQILKYNLITIVSMVLIGYISAHSFSKYVPDSQYMKGMKIDVKK